MISSKKAETIQGFLSPTKLLSGGSKLRQTGRQQNGKSPLNTSYKKAVSSPNGNDQSQNQSYLNTSRQLDREESPPRYNDGNFSRLTGGENVGYEGRNQRKYESERNIGWESKAERKPIGVAREIIEEDEGYGRQRTLEEINNRRWQTHNPNTQFNAINLRQSPSGNARMLQSNPTASFKPTTFSSKPSLSQQSPLQTSSMLKNSNPEVMTIQCYELLRKLSKIKQTLQLQILQLQTLLDNTSKYMDNMEGEFERIKDSILSYTASCLDNAFAEYRKNMVEWSKYEDFERKSLTMLSQINDYIYNQQQKLSSPKKPSYRQMTSSAQQFQRQIQFYGQFSEEIRKIRQQCIGMRPTLTAERIRQYEKGLAVLCNF